MKKQFQSLALLLIAGLTFAACSSEIIEENTPVQPKKWTVTANVGKVTDLQTRTLTYDDVNNAVKVGWNTSENIFVYRSGVKIGVLAPKTSTSESTTVVEGVFEEVSFTVGEELTLRFPREVVDYSGQDGTLATIASNYDYAEGTTTVESISGTTVVFSDVTLTSKQTIVRFQFDKAVNTVKVSSASLFAPITVNLASASNVVFVALPLTATSAADYTIECSNASSIYKNVRSNIAMENGKFYTAHITLKETINPVTTPLTLQATVNGTTVTINNPLGVTFKYRINGGTPTTVSDDPITINLSADDKLAITCNGTNTAAASSALFTDCTVIHPNKTCYVYGNVYSLISENNFTSVDELTVKNIFAYLFADANHIINHPDYDIVLPATTLSVGCYDNMFSYCENLTRAPSLPATTLKIDCYSNMFSYCYALTDVPTILPATSLVQGCYSHMFYRCTSLEKAPELPATTLVRYCYQMMFCDCSALNYVKCLATNFGDSDGTQTKAEWLSGVSATGTFVKAPAASWSQGSSGIPVDWTVQDAY